MAMVTRIPKTATMTATMSVVPNPSPLSAVPASPEEGEDVWVPEDAEPVELDAEVAKPVRGDAVGQWLKSWLGGSGGREHTWSARYCISRQDRAISAACRRSDSSASVRRSRLKVYMCL